MKRTIALSAVLTMVTSAMLGTATAVEPAEVGRWLPAFSEDGDGDGIGDFSARPPRSRAEAEKIPTAVNVVVLPDGRIAYWSQLDGSESVNGTISLQLPENPRSRSRILDLSSYFASGVTPPASAWSTPSPEDGGAGDMLGSEQRLLADGRVLSIGGAEWSNEDPDAPVPFGRTELYGTRAVRVLDPSTQSWASVDDLEARRYYPSMVTMPSGRLLIAGGAERLVYNSGAAPGAHPGASVLPENVTDIAWFDPTTDTMTTGAPESRVETVLFPHLHLLPDGSVLHPAAGMIFPPGGGDKDSLEWVQRRVYDPETGRWNTVGVSETGVRGNAFSVLLPLKPPYDYAETIVGGGTSGVWPGSHLATPLVSTISWTPHGVAGLALRGAPLTQPRWGSTAVLSPTGEVLAFNGADKDEVVDPGSGIAVRTPEIRDPESGRWRALAPAARDRTLHSTAVLLRDGSVLVGGHSPIPAHYGYHTANPAPLSNNFKDPSFEIFQPPYLFRGERPTVASLSSTALRNRGSVTITTPDESDPTLRATLVRLPSTTHAIDNDQRAVELRSTGGTTYTIPNPNVAPPGWYYLFLTKDNGWGATPSIAEIVHIS